MKAHDVFLAAAAALQESDDSCRFVCVGQGASPYAEELHRLPTARRLGGRLRWVDSRADMSAVYSALDCLVLASAFGEGLPNVVAEAMACGVSCVVTNVGDSAAVVGDTGVVVPPGDVRGVAEACRLLLSEGPDARARRGRAARARILDRYSIAQLVSRTAAELEALMDEVPASTGAVPRSDAPAGPARAL